jgi:single-stranded-DNA-specific exonuclease
MRSNEWVRRKPGPAPEPYLEKFGSLLGRVLWARGYDSPSDAEEFLNPKLEQISTPFKLLNMDASSDLVAEAIIQKKPIAVYADYDMDGMSGLALLVSFFRTLTDSPIVPYQPHRFEDGYGVHASAIETLADQGVKLVITVDTGITAVEAARAAKKRGVDFVITDHHLQVGELPDTLYTINPNQKACMSGLRYLSGAGVAFYLAIAVRKKLRDKGFFVKDGVAQQEPDLRQWLDFFVLGTIADHVDLVDDNRILTRAGLRVLLNSTRPGIAALRSKVLPNAKFISTRDVGFSMTPKLNAASRLGKAQLSTELLLTEDPVRGEELANELMTLNDERSKIQSLVFEEALAQANSQVAKDDPPVLVVHGNWHEGVLGVVAAKLTDKFGRPSIVLTKLHDLEMHRGSMRTLAPVSCVRALDACRDLLHRYGGHKMAAGLQIKSHSITEFRERLWDGTKKFLATLTELEPVSFDEDLPENLSFSEVEALEGTSPWGSGNPEPLFKVKSIDLSAIQMLKGQHLKCQLSNGLEVIGFFKSDDVERLKKTGSKSFDALVTPEINRFRNQKNIQLRLHYVRPSEAADLSFRP